MGRFGVLGNGGWGVVLWRLGKGRKVFFSEEKKQKTFARLSRPYPAAYAT
jgi:hypothetical protein